MNGIYDTLQYPLLFSYGDHYEWHDKIFRTIKDKNKDKNLMNIDEKEMAKHLINIYDKETEN